MQPISEDNVWLKYNKYDSQTVKQIETTFLGQVSGRKFYDNERLDVMNAEGKLQARVIRYEWEIQ